MLPFFQTIPFIFENDQAIINNIFSYPHLQFGYNSILADNYYDVQLKADRPPNNWDFLSFHGYKF